MEFMLICAILISLGYNSQNSLKLLFSSESLKIGDFDLQSVLEILAELVSSMKSNFSKLCQFSIKFIRSSQMQCFPYCSGATFSYQDDFL